MSTLASFCDAKDGSGPKLSDIDLSSASTRRRFLTVTHRRGASMFYLTSLDEDGHHLHDMANANIRKRGRTVIFGNEDESMTFDFQQDDSKLTHMSEEDEKGSLWAIILASVILIILHGSLPIVVSWTLVDGEYEYSVGWFWSVTTFLTFLQVVVIKLRADYVRASDPIQVRQFRGIGITKDGWRPWIPVIPVAFCNSLNNYANAFAQEYVSPSTISVLKNSSILMIGLLSTCLLKKKYTPVQWIAMSHMTMAVICFVLITEAGSAESDSESYSQLDTLIGFSLVLGSRFFFCFGLVFQEKLTVDGDRPFWDIQFRFTLCVFLATLLVFICDPRDQVFLLTGVFTGWNYKVWVCVAVAQAFSFCSIWFLVLLGSMLKQLIKGLSLLLTVLLDVVLLDLYFDVSTGLVGSMVVFVLLEFQLVKKGAVAANKSTDKADTASNIDAPNTQ